MSFSVGLPAGDAQIDIHADQRGRIIGSCVAIFIITDISVLLRLVSRKLARAGYWVSEPSEWSDAMVNFEVLMALPSGMMFSPLWRW